MPTVAVYVNGMSAGTAGRNIAPSKRGEVKGWSQGAVRRHTRWLYGVDAGAVDGHGLAVTLTVRDIPESAAVWQAARAAFIKRMERRGLVRLHWVVEWTARRRPHLHMALYFPADLDEAQLREVRGALVDAWRSVAGKWGVAAQAQHVAAIDGPLGWLQYLSKHAARGVAHYQRQGKPTGWDKTGRLWGYTGEWPTHDPMKLELSRQAMWELRRLIRSWRIADARGALALASDEKSRRAAARRLVGARRMLRCGSRGRSEARGVSEWVPEGQMAYFAGLLADRGHLLHQS
jgi:hypothetical protein